MTYEEESAYYKKGAEEFCAKTGLKLKYADPPPAKRLLPKTAKHLTLAD
jgi:hypothetical protein